MHTLKYQKGVFMKNRVLLFLGICTLSGSMEATTNKTFFMPRTIGMDNVYENAIKRYRFNHINSPISHNASIMPFYQESTNSTDLARYFFPNNKDEIVVKDFSASGDKDVAADWLKIQSLGDAFESKVKIRPRYKSFGAVVHHHKRFQAQPRAWVTAFLPFVETQSRLNFSEFDKQNEAQPQTDIGSSFSSPSADTIHNATEGLNHPLWKYGKFSNHLQKVAGLADIHLRGGFDIIHWKHLLSGLYVGITIPTSFRPKAEFIAEPILGNGGHFAIGGGKHSNIEIRFKNKKFFNIIGNIDYYYLTRNTQRRSFDLISNGPWSRYLLLMNQSIVSSAQVGDVTTRNYFTIPGINVFTKEMFVTPRSVVNFLFATHFNCRDFHFETGYNFWWKEGEKVRLKHPWGENVGIATFTPKQTHDNATIATNRATSSTGFTAISESNLNIQSAAHPSAHSHKLYVTAGGDLTWKGNPFGLYGGGGYEFGESNRSLDQWSIWAMMHIAL